MGREGLELLEEKQHGLDRSAVQQQQVTEQQSSSH